jgi:TatD DNase family protein
VRLTEEQIHSRFDFPADGLQCRPFSGELKMHSALVDIGANLGHDSFDPDLPAVVERARLAGIAHIIVTGTTLASTSKALRLTEQFTGLSATAGVHPHEAQHSSAEEFEQIKMLATHPAVKAVGETGLDFNRDYSPRPVQEKIFTRQLELASTLNKPVFLHQRDAHQRFYPILKEYRDLLPANGVVHCFTGSREELYAYLDMDMYIGITGWICDERRGSHLLPLIKDIPADRLLLETDAPYLLPRSLKPKPASRRNEPAWLVEVLDTVARCSEKSPALIAEQTSANAVRLFGLQL